MKILILGFSKLMYMPYINFYLQQMDSNSNEIHVVCWNRDNKPDITLEYKYVLHEFNSYQEDEVNKFSKIKNFLRYRKNVKKIIKEEKYDLIIVLHTLPGILTYDILQKEYRKKYIYDYRDFTYENIYVYRKIVSKLVENSQATFISSEGFKKYLPNTNNAYITHNVLLDCLNYREIMKQKNRNNKIIRISFWGFIRHEKINKMLIEKLGNDNRFELNYYGREQATAFKLKHFCKENNIRNVFFHGTYIPEERYKFAETTDLIHNIYENDKQTKNAMANKFYDGVALYIPQLCNLGSFMGEKISKSKIGVECDLNNENLANEIYNYYKDIKWDDFEKNCEKEWDEIYQQYRQAEYVVKNILMPQKQRKRR